MPSLPKSTYENYFTSTTNLSIITQLGKFTVQCLFISILWVFGNFWLNYVWLQHHDIYATYYLYLFGQLYWFLIPYCVFIYIICHMLFNTITTTTNTKYYVAITMLYTLLIVFIITATIGIFYHHEEKSVHSSVIKSQSICRNIRYHQECNFLSVYIVTLYAISFCLIFTIATTILYIIQMYPRQPILTQMQSIFCCKKNLHQLQELQLQLLNSADMQTDIDMKIDTININKQQEENEETSSNSLCLCYDTLQLKYKYLLLLLIINISLFLCFIIFTFNDGATRLFKEYYKSVMIMWLILCYILKCW
eukprot:290657_1